MGCEFDRTPVGGATGALNVYVDSSVLLRVVLREPGRIRIWSKITVPVANELVRVECLRTIDRARIQCGLDDEIVAAHRAAVLQTLEEFDVIEVGRSVLERAEDPFPTVFGSLDAIHLASALLVRDELDDLSLATHDAELALAARAVGFRVYGASDRGRSAPRPLLP